MAEQSTRQKLTVGLAGVLLGFAIALAFQVLWLKDTLAAVLVRDWSLLLGSAMGVTFTNLPIFRRRGLKLDTGQKKI